MKDIKKEIAELRWEAMNGKQVRHGDVAEDMHMMHNFYGAKNAMGNLSKDLLKEFLKFRLQFIQEELNETTKALNEKDAEEIVDGLIDIVVVAVGTLDLYDVDFKKAWLQVLDANMNKEVGVKEERPNPFSLPDLIKPTLESHGREWEAPCHKDLSLIHI